ncbi:MAG: NlpC/P60 family protein [Bacteroidota bacterium]
MNRLLIQTIICFGCIICSSCNNSQSSKNTIEAIQSDLEDLAKAYAPDSRDHKFEFEIYTRTQNTDGQSFEINAYTTLPGTAASITDSIAAKDWSDAANYTVRQLPDSIKLDGKLYGIIKVSVASLRSKPGHSQELATQLLHGMPVWLLDRQEDWYLVRCPDNYLAWLNKGDFIAVSRGQLSQYLSNDLIVYRGESETVNATFEESGRQGQAVPLDLVPGAIFELANIGQSRSSIRSVDGRLASIESSSCMRISDWSTQDVSKALDNATYSLGKPYLWGGTSTRAADCSGFTKMCFYMAGFIIPRDASQQVKVGIEIPLDDQLSALQANDLLFFGKRKSDGSQRITHVALYHDATDRSIFHAGADNGLITKQSLKPDEPDFAAHRLASLLAVRRYDRETAGLINVRDVLSIDFW